MMAQINGGDPNRVSKSDGMILQVKGKKGWVKTSGANPPKNQPGMEAIHIAAIKLDAYWDVLLVLRITGCPFTPI